MLNFFRSYQCMSDFEALLYFHFTVLGFSFFLGTLSEYLGKELMNGNFNLFSTSFN